MAKRTRTFVRALLDAAGFVCLLFVLLFNLLVQVARIHQVTKPHPETLQLYFTHVLSFLTPEAYLSAIDSIQSKLDPGLPSPAVKPSHISSFSTGSEPLTLTEKMVICVRLFLSSNVPASRSTSAAKSLAVLATAPDGTWLYVSPPFPSFFLEFEARGLQPATQRSAGTHADRRLSSDHGVGEAERRRQPLSHLSHYGTRILQLCTHTTTFFLFSLSQTLSHLPLCGTRILQLYQHNNFFSSLSVQIGRTLPFLPLPTPHSDSYPLNTTRITKVRCRQASFRLRQTSRLASWTC